MQGAHCESSGILQIHATTRCNLACAHCYSSSSPGATATLPADAVCRLIEAWWCCGTAEVNSEACEGRVRGTPTSRGFKS